MQDGALFIGWGATIAGRETAALDVFNEAKEFYEGLKKTGEITDFEPVLLTHVGGPIEGFFLLYGDPAKLMTVATREDFVRLSTKASLVCKGLTIAPAYVGNAVPTMVETYRTVVNTLALQHQPV